MVRVAFPTALVLALTLCTAWPRAGTAFTTGTPAPEFAGENWIYSKPLKITGLKGRVVLVEFWTYG